MVTEAFFYGCEMVFMVTRILRFR
uniref:Uncharacterized protein n=1 Tax=Arundo donax TaxID=35708 RepID=A0A0A9BA74_ARUDO